MFTTSLASRYALVRSVTHEDNGHGSAMYANFTGWPHPRPNTNPLPAAEDYPAYGAAISHLRHLSGIDLGLGEVGIHRQRCECVGPQALCRVEACLTAILHRCANGIMRATAGY